MGPLVPADSELTHIKLIIMKDRRRGDRIVNVSKGRNRVGSLLKCVEIKFILNMSVSDGNTYGLKSNFQF